MSQDFDDKLIWLKYFFGPLTISLKAQGGASPRGHGVCMPAALQALFAVWIFSASREKAGPRSTPSRLRSKFTQRRLATCPWPRKRGLEWRSG
jgi:hypothetical protein